MTIFSVVTKLIGQSLRKTPLNSLDAAADRLRIPMQLIRNVILLPFTSKNSVHDGLVRIIQAAEKFMDKH